YDDGEKNSLILLKNVTQEAMDEVVKYPEILFIAIEKNQHVDYSGFEKIAVFNKKTKKFTEIKPKSQISPNSLAYKWVGEKIVGDLRSLGLFEVVEYLDRIFERVKGLFDLLPTMNKSLYQKFCSILTPQEQKVVIAICEHYFKIKTPEYTKKTYIQKKDVEEEKQELKVEIEQEQIPENAIDEERISQEIWNLLEKGSSKFTAFSLALTEIEIPTDRKFSTPEKKYYYLRSNQWNKVIPIEFFKNLYLYFVREEIKSDNITKSELNHYLLDKHDQLIDACSMFASPEFKRMDPSRFANDETLKSYLKKEPMVSHFLPVEKNKNKSVSPIEISNMFSHQDDTLEKNSFENEYQKNLTRLRKEFGQEPITPELIQKLRKHNEKLERKITELFQN
ncbi:MAG: hypothetical protein ACTSWC_04510, partial [Promethearchaeota archaeon]